MTRAEAEALCTRYAAEHPDRAVAQWRPQRRADGSWIVVKVGLAPASPTDEEQRADERPPMADDPRTAAMQNLGPHTGLVI